MLDLVVPRCGQGASLDTTQVPVPRAQAGSRTQASNRRHGSIQNALSEVVVGVCPLAVVAHR